MAKQTGNDIYNLGPECRERMLPISTPKLDILSSRGIVFAGINDLKGTYHVRHKSPLCHHLLYTLNGSGWIKTQGIESVLEPGKVWISPKRVSHEFRLHGESWLLLWWALRDKPPWSLISSIGPVIRNSVFGIKFKPLMEDLFWTTQTQSDNSDKAITMLSELSLLYLEWELGFGQENESQQDLITGTLVQLFEKVRMQLHLPWTVESLQEKSGLYYSNDHFSRICCKCLGVRPMQKVIQLRMERASDLLLNTKFTLQTIADMIGYKDSFSFSTAFKRWSG
ncbi:MAG: AraC family transcriptional regulator, partial [Candidatus Cloacimonetes bacterium]|nr:AraC family transcriptional regulator [Candidatus Cloacimonadota bacterium]